MVFAEGEAVGTVDTVETVITLCIIVMFK